MTDGIKFYKVNDSYGCFSNFSAHKIFIETTWPTSEHFFQAQKFLDYEIRRKIQQNPSPMEAAKIGRDRSLPLRQDWETVKIDIMRQALQAKIIQHADVRETLLSTKSLPIIEHTKNDSYWADGGDGTGLNMLGKLLMEIRSFINFRGEFNELLHAPKPPWMAYPELDSFSMGWRMGGGEAYLCDWSDCRMGWENWYYGLTDKNKKLYHIKYPIPDDFKHWFEDA